MMNPIFYNIFLATKVNLFFVSKIGKDLKSVIETIFPFLYMFLKRVLGWKFGHVFNHCHLL